ncbi:ribosomal large subunit pseudouridine synthase D [Oceanospirillum multiglobuliferum]|uniref:Pseudouridine synthase n=1 Tax=Oceanospirillum multiglobuliferum TaxID=64969 RepID=A0A1T4RNB4_9GAMM|nr:23S rRNA pseudouridine(1911/1915/1917) synthase RluD [Oceanospirillum multiglobuliferum]OPX54767.1 23S rRNA pseudouridine(1911/1915/1917) synthase [Oceanospirillum multiglobuliferum]SKA17238.1 ribosomal large subunit pseudouridine synthase D [Oceanospirillum multiglobuliferum]
MAESISLQATVPFELTGSRIDQAAAELFPEYSRARLQSWIKEGTLTANGVVHKPKDKLIGGELLVVNATVENSEAWQAQDIELDIVYEDDDILVINKPAGLVVHPAAGHHNGTLLNALLHHAPEMAHLPRVGIVHRLDKDTTGLMVVAKNLIAQNGLVEQLQDRSMGREYEAIATGFMTGGGKVDAPIARHQRDRKRMAVVEGGKHAVTHYRVVKRFRGHTHVRCKLETGRTHQIRVHMAYVNYPLLGDPVYGGRLRLPAGCTEELRESIRQFPRQALHAKRLELWHPVTGDWMEWEIDLPEDMKQMLAILEADMAADKDA